MNSEMKILLSNDDGIDAPGIKLLEKIVANITNNITVIAPNSNRSGASHTLTLHNPLRSQEIAPNHYAINGSPCDCVAYGLRHLWKQKDEFPDLVISGINSDANLAEDIIYSGTVAVAREASLFGIPSISLSLQRDKSKTLHWETAEKYAPIILKKLINNLKNFPKLFVSVNFPGIAPDQVKGVKVVSQGKRIIEDRIIEQVDPRGQSYYWIGIGAYGHTEDMDDVSKDIGAINQGYITILPLTFDQTAFKDIPGLKDFCDETF